MVQTLPSPPLSRSTTPTNIGLNHGHTDQLVLQLDDLLAQYLELLDEYTKARTELSIQLSEGYFALARAQQTSNMGAGRRYGRDGYDSRMKAIRRVGIRRNSNASDSDGVTTFECQTCERNLSSDATKPANLSESLSVERGNTTQLNHEQDSPNEKPKIDPAYRDPATWYGLLVPATLRDTQQRFAQIVQTSIPSLLATKASMEGLEQLIWDVRASLGIEDQYIKSQSMERETPDALAEIDRLLAKAKLKPRT